MFISVPSPYVQSNYLQAIISHALSPYSSASNGLRIQDYGFCKVLQKGPWTFVGKSLSTNAISRGVLGFFLPQSDPEGLNWETNYGLGS